MIDCTTLTFNSEFGDYGKLDLYSSSSATTATPLVVFIHGGAWRTEDKRDHKNVALGFVNQGFTVAVTNYRLSIKETPDAPPQVQHPSHIQDTYQALTFLHANRNNNNTYNHQQMFLVGHSAGAHIATMLLLDTYDVPFVAGAIGADGIYDITLLLATFPSYLDFIGQGFGLKAQYDDDSPISKSATGVPPVLLVHSMDDQLLDLAQTESMYRHLKRLGVAVTLDTTSVKGDHYAMIQSDDFCTAASHYIHSLLGSA